MRQTLILTLFAALALGSCGKLEEKPAAKPASGSIDWRTRVTLSKFGGYVMGNPAAPTKIVEYVSYTCPHCARLTNGTGDALEIGWVQAGKASIEIRNVIFNGFDFTAAILARCGGPTKFYGNHKALFGNYDSWMGRLRDYDAIAPSMAGKDRAAIMLAMADKTGLMELMTKRGFTRPQLVACLNSKPDLESVQGMSASAAGMGINSTPSVFINGKLAPVGEQWENLKAALSQGTS